MIPKSYDEFIIKKLSINTQELNYKIINFAVKNGIGIDKFTPKELIQKCLYEYGITNAEIKSAFIEYLGLEDFYFRKKYGNDATLLPMLSEHGLISIAHKGGNITLYDAEFYFSDIKFQKAVQIYKEYVTTS